MSAKPSDHHRVTPSGVAVTAWSEREPIPLRLAQAWADHAPRATSWLPRKIGRIFGRRWTAAVRTPRGCLLSVDSTNLDVYTTIRHSDWEPGVFEVCCQLLRPGDVFLDAGANVGYVAIGVGTRFQDQVGVIAFEPQSSLARHILISAALNRLANVAVFEALLGEVNGTARLYLSAHAVHASVVPRNRRRPSIASPSHRLDDLIYAGAIPAPTVLKLDVEGAELRVLRGARALLVERPPCLVIESDENMERFSYTRQDLLEYLTGCGNFAFYGVRADGTLTSTAEHDCRDILAVPSRFRPRLQMDLFDR